MFFRFCCDLQVFTSFRFFRFALGISFIGFLKWLLGIDNVYIILLPAFFAVASNKTLLLENYLLKKIKVITGLQNNPLSYQCPLASNVEVLGFHSASCCNWSSQNVSLPKGFLQLGQEIEVRWVWIRVPGGAWRSCSKQYFSIIEASMCVRALSFKINTPLATFVDAV